MDRLLTRADRLLDRTVRFRLSIGRRSMHPFRACGLAGLTLSTALTMTLAAMRHLSPWTTMAITVIAATTFVLLTLLTRMITGREVLVYYHHEIAIMLTVTALLHALNKPVLAYLDITLVGLGLLLACGRMAACSSAAATGARLVTVSPTALSG